MPDNQNLELLLTTQTDQLNLVFGDSNGIDAKALALLGVNVAAFFFVEQASLHLHAWQFTLIYSPFVLSFILDIFAVWQQDYLGVIPNGSHINHYLELSHQDLLLQLLANTQTALRQNEAINRKRLRYFTASIVLTVLGFLILLLIL